MDREGVALDAPAALLVDQAGEPVGAEVGVGRDVEAVDLAVVGGVRDDREVGVEERLHPGRELRAAGAPGEEATLVDRSHSQWSASGRPVIRMPAWTL